MEGRRSRAGTLIVSAVVVVLWGLDTHGTFAGSGDEPHYAMIAHSVVFDRDFDLANDYGDPATLVGGGTLTPGAHAIPGRDGTLRPVHDVGLPLIAAPVFGAAYFVAVRTPVFVSPRMMARARLTPALVLRHLLSLAMIAATACLAVLLFRTCRLLGGGERAAMWTLACVLSPPILSHSILFFTEIPTALVVALLLRELVAARPVTKIRALAFGALTGFLLLLHVRNIGLAAAATALFVWDYRQKRAPKGDVAAFLVPVSAFIALRSALTLRFWGTLVTTPIAAPAPPAGLAAVLGEIATRAGGLLFDQEHGLLVYAPLYLLVLPGALVLRRIDRRAFTRALVLLTAYVVPILLPFINPNGWSGGWSPAARFLVPIVPILVLFGFGLLARAQTFPRSVTVLIILQACLDAVLWQHPKLLWNDGTGRSALADYFSRFFDVAAWLPSWHQPSTYGIVVSAVVSILWVAISIRAATMLARSYDLSPSPTATAIRS